MPERETARQGSNVLLVLASGVMIIAGLKLASSLILPFLSALLLALISLPLLNWLRARRFPTPLAVLTTLLTALTVTAAFVGLVGGQIKGFTSRVPTYKAGLQRMSAGVVEFAEERGFDLTDTMNDMVNPSEALDVAQGVLLGVAALVSNSFMVLVTIVLILFEAAGFPDKLHAAFGDPSGSQRYTKIKREIQHYLGIKTLVSLATGLFIGVALWLIGVDFALLWGVLAFLLNYIPTLGSIIASIPPTLLATVQFGPGPGLAVAGVFLAVNIVMGNFVEPYFMGRRLGLSTLVVFMSLVFWGWVWGPLGMLLSVPLTMILKIMLENNRELRWVSVLLGPAPKPEAPIEG